MRKPRLALAAALLAVLATPAIGRAASSPECALALSPPQDARFPARTETPLTLEEYLGARYVGAVEPARPYWRSGCRLTFEVQGGYVVSSRIALFTNASAAESVRRLRSPGFVMDDVERSLAGQVARGALVTRGRSSAGTQVLLALWRRGPALLEVTVLAGPATPLPTRTLTLFTKLQDARAQTSLRG